MAPRKTTSKTSTSSKTEEEKKTKEPVEEAMSPKEYFDILKGKREEASSEKLKAMYDAANKMMQKYTITGQKSGAMKLFKFAQVCEKELKAVESGVTTYVRRKDIDEYITKIASKSVVIIELENYERDIPDDVVEKIAELKEKEIFDDFFVVFTDYTGGERKKVEQIKREKDPILFGAMKIGNQYNTRMYYIADWVDEYCDLTLDKLVSEFSKKMGNTPVKPVTEEYPTIEDFKAAFDKHTKNPDD